MFEAHLYPAWLRPEFLRSRAYGWTKIFAGYAAAGCRVVVAYRNREGSAELCLPEAWRVRPDDALVSDLVAQPSVSAASFSYG